MITPITKEELLQILTRCRDNDDIEKAHSDADDALIAFINIEEVTAAYYAIEKWYA